MINIDENTEIRLSTNPGTPPKETPMDYYEQIDVIILALQLTPNNCSNAWLKQALDALLQRNPVDAVNDLKALLMIFEARRCRLLNKANLAVLKEV